VKGWNRWLVPMVMTAVLSMPVALSAGASTPPTPGTPAQVVAAVAASSKITKINATVTKNLASAPADLPWRIYGNSGFTGCSSNHACVYGDKSSRNVIVLFGDSHAMMWLPAVVPWAAANKYRVVLLWERGCVVARLPTGYVLAGGADAGGDLSNAQCTAWFTSMLLVIKALHPQLLLLGERTAAVESLPSEVDFTESQWQAGMEKSINAVKPLAGKVAVIEDVPWHNDDVPDCLSVHPTKIQECSVTFPNKSFPGQQTAEDKAAVSSKVSFINTMSWFCTKNDKTCSGVIGNYITYRDNGHITASYAQYLSQVMGNDMKSLLS
jgi:hypothetical protein